MDTLMHVKDFRAAARGYLGFTWIYQLVVSIFPGGFDYFHLLFAFLGGPRSWTLRFAKPNFLDRLRSLRACSKISRGHVESVGFHHVFTGGHGEDDTKEGAIPLLLRVFFPESQVGTRHHRSSSWAQGRRSGG